MKRRVGRPPKEPNDLVTIDNALEIIKEELSKKYSPDVAELLCYAKGTLRNKVHKGELHSWRKGKYALLSRAEVLRLVG